MIASYFPVSANFRAAKGISNAPGTRTTSISFFPAPERASPSTALNSSLSVMKALNRETTIANRIPTALSEPSSAGRSARGGASTTKFFLPFFSVTQCLRGGFTLCPSVPSVVKPLTLLPFKRSCPLLQECRSPFLLILSSASHCEQHSFQIQSFAQSHLHAFVHGLHRILNCQRSIRDNLRRNRLRPRNQLRSHSNFIHQPDAMRFLRRNHFAGQQLLHGQAFAHQPRQPLRPAIAWDNPQLHLRLPQLGILTGQPNRASHRHLASATQRKSIDAGNHRLAQILDQIQDVLPAMRILLARDRIMLGQLANVSSGDKRLFARAGHNDNANRRIILNVMKRRPQLLHGSHVECVQNLGAVDGYVSNRVFLFQKYVFEVHRSSLNKFECNQTLLAIHEDMLATAHARPGRKKPVFAARLYVDCDLINIVRNPVSVY